MTSHGHPSASYQQQHDLTKNIAEPTLNDVLCGRGGGTNNHIGNVRFRQLVNGHKLRYLAATKSEKPMVARQVVVIWRNLNPPGRFLAQEKSQGDADSKKTRGKGSNTSSQQFWYDVGDKKAREKASQCLRERTPDVMPFMKELELQLTLEEQESAAKSADVQNANVGGRNNKVKSATPAGLTAAEVSRHLLLQQQEAARAAHVALNSHLAPHPLVPAPASESFPTPHTNAATLPPIPISTTNNNEQALKPIHVLSDKEINISPSENLPTSPNAAVDAQKECIKKEIEMLEKERARLEAEVNNNNLRGGGGDIDERKPAAKDSTVSSSANKLTAFLDHISEEVHAESSTATHSSKHSSSKGSAAGRRHSRDEMGEKLPVAAELLDEFITDSSLRYEGESISNPGDSSLTMEEYQMSIEALMENSVISADMLCDNTALQSLEDMSLASSLIFSGKDHSFDKPEGNIADTFNQSSATLQFRNTTTHASDASSLSQSTKQKQQGGQVHQHRQGLSNQKSERTLSTFETSLLGHMVDHPSYSFLTVNTSNNSTASTAKLNEDMSPPARREKTSNNNNVNTNTANSNTFRTATLNTPSNYSNNSHPVRPSMFALRKGGTGISQVSMMSDLTDLTAPKGSTTAKQTHPQQQHGQQQHGQQHHGVAKSTSTRSMKMDAQSKLKSDISMITDFSDLSSALGTIDMSIQSKEFKRP